MKALLSFACLLALTAFAAQTMAADIAKPKTSEKPVPFVMHRNLEIVPDKQGYSAILQLSKSDVAELRAALDGAPSNTAIAAGIAHSSPRTIVAGLLLFLSVSLGGVLLARSSTDRTRKAVGAAILVVAVLGVAAIITRGNAAPPRSALVWSKLAKNLSQGRTTSGALVIEVVPDDPNTPPNMRLLIPIDPKQRGDE